MSNRSQTIEIFLPDGEPRGLRLAGITTRIVQAIQCPIAKLDRLFARPEAERVAIYFLLGSGEDSSKPQVYIGQTECLRKRLKDHQGSMEFWNSVVALVSRTESFTQVHVRYLEWLSIEKANEADRYAVRNGNAGSRPFIPEPLEADVLDAFETGATLLSALGCPIFEPFVASVPAANQDSLFSCSRRGAQGQGVLTDDGFVLRKGSLCRRDIADYLPNVLAFQHSLLEQGVLEEHSDDFLRVSEDYLCNSPSQAAALTIGQSSNGWIDWKNEAGETLDAVYRQTPDETET